jgi:hypothetical protein
MRFCIVDIVSGIVMPPGRLMLSCTVRQMAKRCESCLIQLSVAADQEYITIEGRCQQTDSILRFGLSAWT